MPTSAYSLAHPETQADWERLVELLQAVAPRQNPQAFVHHYRERPDIDPQAHALLYDQEALVASASFIPHRHYFGQTEVEALEIAMLAVHPDRRLGGLASRLLAHGLAEAEALGASYLYAFGEVRFFERHGFAVAAPAPEFPRLWMRRAELTPILSPLRVRPMTANDVAVVEEIYDMVNCETLLAEVRSPEYWRYRLATAHHGGASFWVVVDAENLPRGYVWADLAQGHLLEAVVADEEAARAVLQWLRWELTERKLDAFTASVPPHQLFAQAAHRLGGYLAHPDAHAPGSVGPLVKLLRLQPLLEGLRARMEVRLANSRYAGVHDFQVTFVMGEEAVSLRLARGRLVVGPGSVGREIALPATAWAPILTGYGPGARAEHLPLDEAERHLLETLFAGQSAFHWSLDALHGLPGA